MKEQLINFETAKLAKEKGFNEEVNECYYLDADEIIKLCLTYPNSTLGEIINIDTDLQKYVYIEGVPSLFVFNDEVVLANTNKKLKQHFSFGDSLIPVCTVCSQSLLQKWLREKYNIHLEVNYREFVVNVKGSYFYSFSINESYFGRNVFEGFDTYEEALEEGLINALNILK